ncbi:A/G-specific adenine glycosylase [Staphylococcus massiliensis]|uniref:Adenine DNA glycosylase n=1 Tax=Staphylococcus massiliensis S46 TaxID=1229783 RepID=K9AGD3_9STAP|nr:A/G-specific adenine glycosylase [Staphylococcus massiliensis]EKU45181.1 A/G-specific adenine glycosylase [Staphylococcus massiliensis S46]MCG3399969.1 A/G-specific adenine glycosylase [Staphylococcus massiliensis]MCG3402688.1 A/G-specific adenine glycosylase [Staphylococcus massiliensis]MCG3412935.1 A/G-specific adenine glycosylase [Staphylococcus massiliensis]POA01556.1 A/G-specific adenine glycosylase [Staphylococcus massiliensis CCUG 55927]
MYDASTFKSDLLKWYDENKREMPWRNTSNPYYIWLSEVMLQQTQVNTVIDYYHRFTRAFPTMEALSEAKEDDVLKMWEGLGYYSRARNFHHAVKDVVNHYDGVVPSDAKKFGDLKGVGPYTKASVLSIAFNKPLPAVDGNVFRVWSRLNTIYEDIKKPATRKMFERDLEPYVQDRSGEFNQAMMELGATVCTPKQPLCLFCPIQSHCEAFDKGVVMELPVKSKLKKKKSITQYVFLIENEQGDLLVEKRTERLLKDMWQFPMYEHDYAEALLDSELDIQVHVDREPDFKLKHQFTHLTWHMYVFQLKDTRVTQRSLPENMTYMPKKDKETFNFPVSMTKVFNHFYT